MDKEIIRLTEVERLINTSLNINKSKRLTGHFNRDITFFKKIISTYYYLVAWLDFKGFLLHQERNIPFPDKLTS